MKEPSKKSLEVAKEIVDEYADPPIGAYYTEDVLVELIAKALDAARADGFRESVKCDCQNIKPQMEIKK